MTSQYSVTIQIGNIDPLSGEIGHVAIVIDTPDGSTFAGFGPNADSEYFFRFYAGGQLDVQEVAPGGTPTPSDYSNALSYASNASFTIPISESQANAMKAEIGAVADSVPNYNIFDLSVCSSIAQRILQAGGLGNPISNLPGTNFYDLKAISDALAADPNASYYYSPTFNQFLAVPEGLRGLQQDYARIGRGFDTPREMLGTPSGNGGENNSSTFFSTSGSIVDQIGNAASSAWSTVTNAVTDTASAALDTVTSAASSVWDYIESTASSAWSTITNLQEQATSAQIYSTDAELAFGQAVGNAISSGATSVWDWVKSTGDELVNGASSAVQTFADTVSSGASSLLNFVESAGQYVADSIITPAHGEANPVGPDSNVNDPFASPSDTGTPGLPYGGLPDSQGVNFDNAAPGPIYGSGIDNSRGADQPAAFLPNPANLVDPNIAGQFGTSGWPDNGLPGQPSDTVFGQLPLVPQASIPDGGATPGGGDTGAPLPPEVIPVPPDVPATPDAPVDQYGPTSPTGYYSGYPVVLDLTGKGIKITPLGSSNQFFDMSGDGYENRTAWAGPGNGVLVFDPTGSNKITSPMQFEFTRWDPTAKSDMQALEDVFDTNHDGKLDAGDAGWNDFGVLVTNADGSTTFESLSQLGITSIDLTTDNTDQVLSDGSKIVGETTYTKSDNRALTVSSVASALSRLRHIERLII